MRLVTLYAVRLKTGAFMRSTNQLMVVFPTIADAQAALRDWFDGTFDEEEGEIVTVGVCTEADVLGAAGIADAQSQKHMAEAFIEAAMRN
jgi:hypothetical protein